MAKKQTAEPKSTAAAVAQGGTGAAVAGEFECRGCGSEDYTASSAEREVEHAGTLPDGTNFTSITFTTVICNRCGQSGIAKRFNFDAKVWGN